MRLNLLPFMGLATISVVCLRASISTSQARILDFFSFLSFPLTRNEASAVEDSQCQTPDVSAASTPPKCKAATEPQSEQGSTLPKKEKKNNQQLCLAFAG